MNAEELFVHDGSDGQRAESGHASFVNLLRVLPFACATFRKTNYMSTMGTYMGDVGVGPSMRDIHSSLNVK